MPSLGPDQPVGQELLEASRAEVGPGEVVQLSRLVRRVVAPNPGPFTYRGTNTYLIGRGRIGVIDGGPADESHVAAVLAALDPRETVAWALVTHTHSDHSPGAQLLHARTGATLAGMDPVEHVDDDDTRIVFGDPEIDVDEATNGRLKEQRRSDLRAEVSLADGDEVAGDGWTLEAIHTPGHAGNHLCYHLKEEGLLFTGDHVMGWSTTVISPPDGQLAPYLSSCRRLLGRANDRAYLPAHGPAILDPQVYLAGLIDHRERRSEQILDVLRSGPASIAEIVPRLYADTAKQLWPAAASAVYAHLIQLHSDRLVETVDGAPFRRGSRFAAA